MANLKLTGIGKNGGFLLSNKGPLDVRTVVTEYSHLADLVSGNRAYVGMLVYVNSNDDKKGLYICEDLNETGIWKLINTGAEIDNSINDYLKNYYTKEEIEEIKTTINSNLEENYATLTYVDENINNHLENKTNPHEVTAEQIGLGNVLNVESYSKVESDELLKNYALKEELFSKNYDDLTNKPEIPSIDGLATEEYVDKAIEAIPEVDLTDYALKDDIRYAEEGLTNSIDTHTKNKNNPHEITAEQIGLGNVLNVASYSKTENDELLKNYALKEELFSKSYNDLTDKPEIPDLTGYATEGYVDAEIKTELENYYTKTEANNEFMTQAEVDSRVNEIISKASNTDTIKDLTSLVDYLDSHGTEASEMAAAITELETNKADKTEIPDLAGYATEGYVDEEVKNELAKLSIPSIDGLATEEYVNEAVKKITIPDVSNFITEVPSEYITETELKNELNTYATTEYVDEKIENIDAIVGDLNITYTNDMETINAVGGIPAGFKFEGEWTIQDILTKLFYPYIDLDYDKNVFKNRISIGTSAGVVTTASNSYTIPTFPTLDSVTFYLKKNSATNLSFKLYAGNEQIGNTLTGDNIVRGTNGGNDSITFTNLNKKIEVNTTFTIELTYTGEDAEGKKEDFTKNIPAGEFSFTFTNPKMAAPTAYDSSNSTIGTSYYAGQTVTVKKITVPSPTYNSATSIKKIELYKNGSLVSDATKSNPTFPYNFTLSDTLTSSSTTDVTTKYKIRAYFDTRTGSSTDTSETSIYSTEQSITFSYAKPTINLSGATSKSNISKLAPESVGSLTATFAKKSGKITAVKLFEKSKDYSTSTEVKSNTIDGYDSDTYSSSNGTSTFNYSKTNICSDLTLTAKAYNGTSAVATSNSITLSFYPPYCYGFVDKDTTMDTVVNNFINIASGLTTSKDAPSFIDSGTTYKNAFKLSDPGAQKKVFFAVPQSSKYSSIKDLNTNMNATGSFTIADKTIKFADNSTVDYQIFLLTTAVQAEAKLQFNE